MKSKFHILFIEGFLLSLGNYYKYNSSFDYFGRARQKTIKEKLKFLKVKTKELIKYILCKHGFYWIKFDEVMRFIKKKGIDSFEYLYDNLSDKESKILLINLCIYHILGPNNVKLKVFEDRMLQHLRETLDYSDSDDALLICYPNKKFKLKIIKYDLIKINYPIKLYGTPRWIVTQYIHRQYTYQTKTIIIKPEQNDIVLDCGAFIGNTALFFANEIGPNGKVYCFEFVKDNIDIFKKNISLNPNLKNRIVLIEKPVWENPDTQLYYNINGCASKVGYVYFSKIDNRIITTSVDQMVLNHKLKRIDFIKMHIEGSELQALKGASETLKKFKPKLAITIYHNQKDFKIIAEFIKSISAEYQLYLDHYSMNHEDTVLYAIHS